MRRSKIDKVYGMIFDILEEFITDWYALVSKYQVLFALILLVTIYRIFIRKVTTVTKEDYIMAPPVHSDQPYVGEELPLVYPMIPPISGWFKTKLIRCITNTCFKNFLNVKVVKIVGGDYNRTIIYPEAPTFVPHVLPHSSLLQKKQIQDDHLWHLIKERPDDTGDSFEFVSISDLISLYKQGKKTPETVMKTLVQCIVECEKQKPCLKGFIEYYTCHIMEQAVASTQRWKEGRPLSVLDGIPVSFKDEFIVGNHHSRGGTPVDMYDTVHAISDEKGLVEKLRGGGAIIIGMTNMHQCGIGVTGINPSPFHGTPRNPYNVDFTTGASSSGSATVVASGLCVASLGTDGGGSIRIPAACCGLVGLKPTYGWLSTAGMVHNASIVTHTGPLCANVRDTAIMFGYLAGKHTNDIVNAIQPPFSFEEFDNFDVSQLKIGVDQVWMSKAQPEIQTACENAVKLLKRQYNVVIVDIHVPEKLELHRAHTTMITSSMLNKCQILKDVYTAEMNIDTLTILDAANNFTAHDYLQAAKQRTRSINALKYIFTQVDIILTPAFGQFQPKLTSAMEKYGYADIPLTLKIMQTHPLGNLTGIPGITLPVGYSDNNLPIAVHLMSSWWREDMLLQMAYALEKCVKRKAPQVYFDIRK